MKKYLIKFTKKGKKMFFSLPKNIRERIGKKLVFFENIDDPFDYAKKLSNRKDKYRFRIGDYRIIFIKQFNGELVILLILEVGHRKEIYKN